MRNRKFQSVVAAVALLAFSCTNEINRSAAPVELIVTNTQDIFQIDLAGGEGCDQSIGTISMRAILKNPVTGSVGDQRFNDVRVTRYRVSYVRTDGGRTVPAPFVRAIDTLLTTGGSEAGLTNFIIIESDALRQAPFAALLPNNGGRDPDTGRPVVKLEVVVEIFGETLAGENVSGGTRFPLDFCYGCGGCG